MHGPIATGRTCRPAAALRGRLQVAGARVALRCRGRLPRAVNNFRSALPCGWHFSKPRRGAIWCHSDTTQICVTPQKCFCHQRAMGCLVSTLLSCSGCFPMGALVFRTAMIRSSMPHRAPPPGNVFGGINGGNGGTKTGRPGGDLRGRSACVRYTVCGATLRRARVLFARPAGPANTPATR